MRDVETAGQGSMRFLPQAGDVSWIAAQPVGAYAHSRRADAHRAGLYRATIYVGRYLRAWPPATRSAWTGHAAACRAEGVADDLVRIERAWSILFGAEIDAAGVVVPVPAPDRAWLAGHSHEPVAIDVKLRGLFTAVPAPAPAAWSDGVLRLCHELTTAPATDPLFGAMAAEQWRAKWCGAAAFAYVGLREVDALAFGPGLTTVSTRPTVIVEPLPAVWEALRWLQRRRTDARAVLEPDLPADKNAAWIDTVLEALALQQQGVDLPAAQNEQLADLLMKAFEGDDDGLGIPSRIEGVPAQVRRAVPQLVRVPIRWRGETKMALALRLFVEQEGPAGAWQVPAWSAPATAPATAAPAAR